MGMTEQNAIEWLSNDTSPTKIHIAEMNNENPMDYIDSAIIVATNALEKQIPKKLNNIHQHVDHKTGYCPSCNTRLAHFGDMNYCHKCGVKLDWENENVERFN